MHAYMDSWIYLYIDRCGYRYILCRAAAAGTGPLGPSAARIQGCGGRKGVLLLVVVVVVVVLEIRILGLGFRVGVQVRVINPNPNL